MGRRPKETHAPNPEIESDLPLLVLDVRNGVSHPPRIGHNEMHWHEDVQFILFIEGEATVDTPTSRYVCREGNAVLVMPNALHRVTSGSGSIYTSFVFPARILTLVPGSDFSAKAVTARTSCDTQAVFHFDGSEPWHAELIDCLWRVRDSVVGQPHTAAQRYRAAANLCSAWGCFVCNARVAPPEARAAKVTDRMRAALAFMASHLAEPLSIADIARAAAASESSVLRDFRASMDTTPGAYLRSLRVEKAIEYVRDPDIPLSDVAALCGFADASHLSHTFKRCVGMTPSAYREALFHHQDERQDSV